MQKVRFTPALAPAGFAALVLLAGVLLDFFTPEPYTGLPLLAAGPLVAGAMLSHRATLAFAVAACALALSVDLLTGGRHGRSATARYTDLAVVGMTGVLALVVSVLLEHRNRDLARVRDIAEAVQRAVLPDPPARVGPLAVAARYLAAQAEARIGGDLFAVQDTPFGVRMIIGDVRGKGLPAVMSMSATLGAFRVEAHHSPTLAHLAQRLDEALALHSERTKDQDTSEDFTTALLVEVSPDGAELRLVNCGHPAPYMFEHGTVIRLEPAVARLPLGMRLPTGNGLEQPPSIGHVPLLPGASLLLVTDGVTEARNREGVFFAPESHGLADHLFTNPGDLLDTLTSAVHSWTGGRREDDMAILAVTRMYDAAAPEPHGG